MFGFIYLRSSNEFIRFRFLIIGWNFWLEFQQYEYEKHSNLVSSSALFIYEN